MIELKKLLEGETLPENCVAVMIKVGKEKEIYGLNLDEHKERLDNAVKYLIGVCIGRARELQGGE
jgi:hypothetical protein